MIADVGVVTATRTPATFDVCGPLPTGATVLEASAGTGKTFTIAALAARYVAEGHAALPELMLVTFGREATTELRERVRERLVSAERGLAEPAVARRSADDVLRLLAAGPDTEVAERRSRLTRALAGFDAATIATTHQFCQQMLAGLGVAGDSDREAVFVESIDDLITEVVDDFYVRKYGMRGAGRPVFGRAEALALARRAVHDGQARLEPADAPDGSPAQVRHRFAAAVRAEVARRKHAQRRYTYDDMLTRLAGALADPAGPAARRLRARYRVVLVDEFQDTDPVQWHILRSAFLGRAQDDGHPALVLIGDPKQAIYAFRGADVVSYLQATDAADRHATLGVNWRSDAPLVAALDTVFAGAALGEARIRVHGVASAHPGQRLTGAPVTTPLRLRVVARAGLPLSARKLAIAPPARELVARDGAADIAALLASPARVDGRPIVPGDVAVLVRTNDQAAVVRRALADTGVPAVLSGTSSVFGTAIARDWLTLLTALEQPRASRLRAAALTPFVGATAEQLCSPGGATLLERLGTALREWAAVLHEHGVAALLEALTSGTELTRRLLAVADGERLLTDLRHVAQALHAAAVSGHLGHGALVDWLRHRIADAGTDVGAERSRRLESDAAAVQIITVHRSKGLEFPIVHVPFGWDRFAGEPAVPLFHDDRGARVLDVGGSTGSGWTERCARHRAEEAGEDLRLLYVALTRARCQVVTWWVPATTVATSPLHRLLFGRAAPGVGTGELAESYRVPDDPAALDALRALASESLAVEPVTPRVGAAFRPARTSSGELVAARFGRTLDTAWRRTSYTALTAATGHGPPGVSSEPEVAETDDEAQLPVATAPGPPLQEAELPAAAPTAPEAPVDAGPAAPEVPVDAGPAAPEVPSPMAELPVGAGFGTLVHAILEAADLTAPDLLAELTTQAEAALVRHPVAGVEAAALAAALVPAAQTPLGPHGGGLRLVDIGPRDRLAELDFELPLAGGDGDDPGRPGSGSGSAEAGDHDRGGPRLGDIAPLLRAHLRPHDPLAGYPDLLAAPPLARQPLRGYLTGSIDAVLRLPGNRFTVVDYKTNWLGPVGPDGPEPLTAAHYTPPRLAAAMCAAHYPLQALIYSVALHRYLRWRLPGYTPAHHLGGVLYLFLRGMCGPGTPAVGGATCGVFGWAPPAGLVAELSALLDGARAGGGRER